DDLKNLIPPVDWTYITTVLLEDGDEKKHDKVFSTLKAANFMNIEPLRDLCCATIANMLRGKNETEILSLFGILEPFTPDEEEKLFQEYEWLREKKD
ncbi:SCF ubiquitin ligase complex protein SKP1a, partial [Diplonema papillatum]